MKTLADLKFPVELRKFRVFNQKGDFVETKLSEPMTFRNPIHYVTFSCGLKDAYELFLGQNITVEAE